MTAPSRLATLWNKLLGRADPSGLGAGTRNVSDSSSSSATPGEVPPRRSSTYGYSPNEPIQVGGGPPGEREYLQSLRGLKGQPVSFKRLGSGPGAEDASVPGGVVFLDMYRVTYDGLEEPVVLFLDMYRRETPGAPAGFRLG